MHDSALKTEEYLGLVSLGGNSSTLSKVAGVCHVAGAFQAEGHEVVVMYSVNTTPSQTSD